MTYFASLNSGSNGNCYYVGNDNEAVLIDAGISARETIRRLRSLEIDPGKINAIVISHEHIDHIRGAEGLAKSLSVPIYITPKTRQRCGGTITNIYSCPFDSANCIQIGDLSVKAFSKMHDADDPHSFVVHHRGINIGVFTDMGVACKNLTDHFKLCHAVFLESNYDDSMLENGSYPAYLKNRIRSNQGHLSNKQALEVFMNYRSPHLSHLLLSHLSKENNHPQLVADLFGKVAGNVEVVVASRYEATSLFCIKHEEHILVHKKTAPAKPMQLGLFS